MRYLCLALLLGAACWIDPDGDEPPATDSETTSGSTATDDTTTAAGSDGETGEADACEPVPDTSCAEASAPALRDLDPGDRLAVSVQGGPEDLVFTDTTVRRPIPPPSHPAYASVFWFGRPEITAPLADATVSDVDDLLQQLPSSPGPRSAYADATVRFADTRACFSVDDGCAPLDDLHGFATDVDTRVLQAWADQASGAVHLLEEIDPQPWPLDLPWGDGGKIEVEASQWRQLDGDWFVDSDDRLAHVRRQCTGTDGTCNRWTLDIAVITVAPSPLDDDDLAQAWHVLELGLGVLVPFDVPADAFAAVAEAHVLALPHTPGGKTRLVTFVAIAQTNLADPI